MTATAADLLPFLADHKVTVFAGAGISVLPPSCLPSWWALNHAVLDALAAVSSEATPSAHEVIAGIKQKQDDGRMPPEYTSEVITDTFGDDYFEVLRCLEGSTFNRVHAWLAALVKAKKLPAIVTTNFDTLIERACEAVGAPLRVLVQPADYEAVDIAAEIANPDTPTLLVKLHGSATDPTTCIDTLAQRKKGVPGPVGNALREIVEATRLCVLGYSGADLEAEPNYLYLRQSAARETPGFDWLMLPDAAVSPAVQDVVDLYADESRARIVRGSLPDWMDPLAAALDGTGIAPPAPIADIDADAAKQEATAHVTNAARAWATGLGPLACAIVVGTLAERVSPQLTLRVREEAAAWGEANETGSRRHGITVMNLGRCYQITGRFQEAADCMRAAAEIFAQREEDTDALSNAIGEMGLILDDLGRLEESEAAFRESLRISEMAEDAEDRIVTRLQLAHVISKTGRMQEAIDTAKEVLDVTARMGDQTNRALALEHIGLLLRDTGNHDESLEVFREAEAIRRRLGQDNGLAYNLAHQASSLRHGEQIAEGHRLLDEAFALADQLGNKEAKAVITSHRAGLMIAVGDFPEAIEQLHQSAAFRKEMQDPLGQLEVTATLVGLLASNGRVDEAIADGEAAIRQAEELGVVGTVGEICTNLGIAYEMKGEFETAVRMYQRAHKVAEDMGDRYAMMMAAANLGNVRYRENRTEEAEAAYREVLATADEIGDINTQIRTLGNLANIIGNRDAHDEAEQMYRRALELAESSSLEGMAGHIWLNLGFLQMRTADWPGCIESLTTARDLLADQGDAGNAGTAAWYCTHAYMRVGQLPEAIGSVQAALDCWDGIGHPLEGDARGVLAQLQAAQQQEGGGE